MSARLVRGRRKQIVVDEIRFSCVLGICCTQTATRKGPTVILLVCRSRLRRVTGLFCGCARGKIERKKTQRLPATSGSSDGLLVLELWLRVVRLRCVLGSCSLILTQLEDNLQCGPDCKAMCVSVITGSDDQTRKQTTVHHARLVLGKSAVQA